MWPPHPAEWEGSKYMTTHLFIAPAAAGKTIYVLTRASAAAQGLAAVPRVLVPTQLQARAARRHLAEMGGAIGVRVLTFDRVYAEVLNAAGEIYTELSEPVQFRLMHAVVEGLGLKHYASLTNRPGFAEVLQRLIGELKAARIDPEAFTRVAAILDNGARLTELAQIYAAYQARLQEQGWADRAGLAWPAAAAGPSALLRLRPGQGNRKRPRAGRVEPVALRRCHPRAGKIDHQCLRMAKQGCQTRPAIGLVEANRRGRSVEPGCSADSTRQCRG